MYLFISLAITTNSCCYNFSNSIFAVKITSPFVSNASLILVFFSVHFHENEGSTAKFKGLRLDFVLSSQ